MMLRVRVKFEPGMEDIAMVASFTIPNGYRVRVWQGGVFVRVGRVQSRVDYHVQPDLKVIDVAHYDDAGQQMEVVAKAVCESCLASGRAVPVIGKVD
jgi:hypothetical protein